MYLFGTCYLMGIFCNEFNILVPNTYFPNTQVPVGKSTHSIGEWKCIKFKISSSPGKTMAHDDGFAILIVSNNFNCTSELFLRAPDFNECIG